MGDNLLSWRAKKHANIYNSTIEAEYRVLATITIELMWFMHLLKSIGYPFFNQVILQQPHEKFEEILSHKI